jgi:hypothetical protein
MARAAPAFVQSYVRDFFDPPVDVGYSPSGLADLSAYGICQADVLFVLETSSISFLPEETPHDQCFSVAGRTCDEELIEVIVCFDSNPAGLCVHHVKRL